MAGGCETETLPVAGERADRQAGLVRQRFYDWTFSNKGAETSQVDGLADYHMSSDRVAGTSQEDGQAGNQTSSEGGERNSYANYLANDQVRDRTSGRAEASWRGQGQGTMEESPQGPPFGHRSRNRQRSVHLQETFRNRIRGRSVLLWDPLGNRGRSVLLQDPLGTRCRGVKLRDPIWNRWRSVPLLGPPWEHALTIQVPMTEN